MPKRHKHGHFVSPATASLGYTIDGGSPAYVDISLANDDCTSIGAGLKCTVPIETTVGSHTFAFTTYDGANGTGHVLSANTQVVYNVKTSSAQQIPVVLGGVAAGFQVFPPDDRGVRGTQDRGYTIYGGFSHTFRIVPVDADGDLIVGPGSPTPVVVATPASMTMATPGPKSPNAWTLTSTYVATDPTVSTTSSISISASPVPYSTSDPSAVTATVPVKLYQPWIYVADNAYTYIYGTFQPSGRMHVYDEQGNAVTPTAGNPFCYSNYNASCTINPSAVAYDGFNRLLYVSRGTGDTVSAWTLEGASQISISGNFSPTPPFAGPNGIALDPVTGVLWISQYGGGYVQTFGEDGHQLGSVGVSGAMIHPMGVTYGNGDIYVVDQGEFSLSPRINVFDHAGDYLTAITGGIADSANKISFDDDDQALYVANGTAGDVIGFDLSNGNQALSLGSCFSGIPNAHAVLYDPYNGVVYAAGSTYAVSGGGQVFVCDPAGNARSVSGTFPGLSNPMGLEVAP